MSAPATQRGLGQWGRAAGVALRTADGITSAPGRDKVSSKARRKVSAAMGASGTGKRPRGDRHGASRPRTLERLQFAAPRGGTGGPRPGVRESRAKRRGESQLDGEHRASGSRRAPPRAGFFFFFLQGRWPPRAPATPPRQAPASESTASGAALEQGVRATGGAFEGQGVLQVRRRQGVVVHFG